MKLMLDDRGVLLRDRFIVEELMWNLGNENLGMEIKVMRKGS